MAKESKSDQVDTNQGLVLLWHSNRPEKRGDSIHAWNRIQAEDRCRMLCCKVTLLQFARLSALM